MRTKYVKWGSSLRLTLSLWIRYLTPQYHLPELRGKQRRKDAKKDKRTGNRIEEIGSAPQRNRLCISPRWNEEKSRFHWASRAGITPVGFSEPTGLAQIFADYGKMKDQRKDRK